MSEGEVRTHVVALYDIHGNLPALDAVLAVLAETIGRRDATIVVGGDVALGPQPRETLDRLLALAGDVRFVRGNCDRLVVEAFDGREHPRLPGAMAGNVAWCARQLGRAHRDFLAALPTTVTVPVDGLGDVLFCHATPRSDEELFTVATPADSVRPMLAETTAALVVCGHTHMPFDREVGGVRVVNAGSVGMPFGPGGADWLRLGPDVRPLHTDYDLARAAATIRATAYPEAATFASRHVLDPEPAASAQARFDRAIAATEPTPE